MPWLPGAIRKPVTRFNAGGDKCVAIARYDGVCNHIAVSDGASLFNYFNQPGNPCSHFYVRKSAPAGATMADFEQYVDTQYRAPANLQGNPRLISIETQGGVGDDLNAGWTPLQLERLAWILAQCHTLHGIPLIAMPNSLPSSRGLGYHRLGIDPWRVDTGELWSASYGKVCPGPARINQQGVILARARAIVNGDTDMPLTPEDITKIVDGVWAKTIVVEDGQDKPASTVMLRLNPGPDGLGASLRDDPWTKTIKDPVTGDTYNLADMLKFTRVDSRNAAAALDDVSALAAAIAAELPPSPDTQAACEAAIIKVLGGLDAPKA